MTPDDFTAVLIADLMTAGINSERSVQSAANEVGPSDLVCRERVRRMMLDEAAPNRQAFSIPALLGTWIHEGMDVVRKAAQPHLIHKHEVTLTLKNGWVITGHPDEIDTEENSVTDWKSTAAAALYRRTGPTDEHIRQVYVYAAACVQMGLLQPEPLVRIAYLDRDAKRDVDFVHCWQEEWDETRLDGINEWLLDVTYALGNGEEASRDWPLEKCRTMCPFYVACRPEDVSGPVIVHPEVTLAAREYLLASDMEKDAKRLKAAARDVLIGSEGITGDGIRVHFSTSNTNSGPVDRIDVRKVT
jgi:hypothetical protein